MTLQLRHIALTVATADGDFGVSIPFGPGLCVLRAPNTSGKSTIMKAILYALGVEGMLGPTQQVPLPESVLGVLKYENREHAVLQSHVDLEIENGEGRAITVRRAIRPPEGADRHLVRVLSGPALTNPADEYEVTDYFVRTGGAARNEAGFSRFLAAFLGWHLPNVQTFSGAEVPLYLEAIFPLVAVEQQYGWTGIQSRMPTYLGIREISKRATEFVLQFDTMDLADRRRRLLTEGEAIRAEWSALMARIVTRAKAEGVLARGLPQLPTATWPVDYDLLVALEGTTEPLRERLQRDEERLKQLQAAPLPATEKTIASIQVQLRDAEQRLSKLSALIAATLNELNVTAAQSNAAASRLEATRRDLVRNKDELRLKKMGSDLQMRSAAGRCPTCGQELADNLLDLHSPEHSIAMSIEENIAYILDQIELFESLEHDLRATTERKETELEVHRRAADELRSTIRAYKTTLTASTGTPSVAALQEQLKLATRIDAFRKVDADVAEMMDDGEELAKRWLLNQRALQDLPPTALSTNDAEKISDFTDILRDQLNHYGFDSFDPNSLSISAATYRPSREGFDIGANISASDNIRLIWSYVNGLMELARTHDTNHPGLLMMDEPRQQEADPADYAMFLARLVIARSFNQQAILATSIGSAVLIPMLQGTAHRFIEFDGPLLRPIGQGAAR